MCTFFELVAVLKNINEVSSNRCSSISHTHLSLGKAFECLITLFNIVNLSSIIKTTCIAYYIDTRTR